MAGFKTLIFFGLLAVALGFTLPDEQFNDQPELLYEERLPLEDTFVLVRRARSPQHRSISSEFQRNPQMGNSARIDYNHQINRNLEAYAGVSRNFKYNENTGHAGLRYRF